MPELSDLTAFVAEQADLDSTKLQAETRLLHDCGLYGDDAEELIRAFATRFGVDLVGFQFHAYFYDEPHGFSVGGLLRTLTGSMHRSPKQPLTIGTLVSVATSGRWPSAPKAAS